MCLTMYNIKYRIIVSILMTKSVSNAIVEIDRPIIKLKQSVKLPYVNAILLLAHIKIITS